MAKNPSRKTTEHLALLRNRIDAARRFREDEGYDDLWERLVDLYRGKHFPKGLSARDKVIVNIAFATINVISPSVAVNYPKITVHATRPENFDRAIITENVLDYWWRKFEFHSEFRRAVDDFLIIGFGWLKTSYKFVEEEEDIPAEEIDAQLDEAISLADELAMEDPEAAADLPTDDEILESVDSTRMVVKEDRPILERISPHDIYVDPEATSMNDIRWIAQRTVRTLEEVRGDEKYDKSARLQAEPDSRVPDKWRPPGVDDNNSDFKRVTVWEFYDVHEGTLAVFSENGDLFLVEPHDQPYEFGHPFVMLRNYDIPEWFYPMGELEAIEGLQQELNFHRSAMLNDSKQKRRAWVYDPSAFDAAGKAALLSDEDNRLIPMNKSGVSIQDVIAPLPSQQLDPQMYQNSDVIENDMTNISGVNEYQRGAAPDIRRTATEASMIQAAADSRAGDKLQKVERIIGHVGRRLVVLAQQFLTEEQVVRVAGTNGQDVWFEFNPDDIQGEFDFEVEGGSTKPKNEQERRDRAMAMFQALAPMAVPGGPVNIGTLLDHVLREGFGITDTSKFLTDTAASGPAAGLGVPPEEMPADEVDPEAAAMAQGIPPAAPVPPEAALGGGGDIPPEIAAQLAGQVGLGL